MPELTKEQLENLNKSTARPNATASKPIATQKSDRPANDPHAQAQQALSLRVQDKAEALQETADIEATQAWEEEMHGIAAYASAKVKAVRASTKAKASLRQQLKQQLEEVEHPIASIEEAQDFFSLFDSPKGRESLPSAS